MLKNKKGPTLKTALNGFTLLEAIIAIATISFVSIFILQMFVVSSRVNKRAQDIDRANIICMGAVEAFKSGTEPIGRMNYEEYFDKDWNGTIDLNRAEYVLNVSILPDSDIYYITAKVSYIGENGEELASLRASKYFAAGSPEGGGA